MFDIVGKGWSARDADGNGDSIVLILTRKPEQGIVIQGNVLIRVLAIDGRRVKLGISAPDDVNILRAELCEASAAEAQVIVPLPADARQTTAARGRSSSPRRLPLNSSQ